jgi:hypothetical protein
MLTERAHRQGHPRAVAARWLVADARDVARIEPTASRSPRAVRTVASGTVRWRRSIERRRVIALLRRVAIVGVAVACALQLIALASGHAGPGLWLVPAVVVAALCLVPGIARGTSLSTAARMLDRDLDLGAGVTTALELEQDDRPPRGLESLALADGREALARSLSGARARLRPRHRESALLAALIAGLVLFVLLPAPRDGGAARAVAQPQGATRHAATANASDPTKQNAGPDLRGYGQPQSPALTGVAASSNRTGGVQSKKSLYGGGTANHSPTGSVQPASRTVGNAGYLQNSRTAGAAASAAASEGAAGHGKSTLTSHEAPAAGKVASAGPVGQSSLPGGQQATGSPTAGGIPGHASTRGGDSRGGGGSSAAGASQTGASRQATPGGATAGGTRGSQAVARGIVPQLGAGKTLPIQPGYEAVKGTKGANGESASDANGAGGASHEEQAATGAAGSKGTSGVAYVPPAGSSVAPVDRRLLIGYFGSFARVAAAGW